MGTARCWLKNMLADSHHYVLLNEPTTLANPEVMWDSLTRAALIFEKKRLFETRRLTLREGEIAAGFSDRRTFMPVPRTTVRLENCAVLELNGHSFRFRVELKGFVSHFTTPARLFETTKRKSCIKDVVAIDPDVSCS